MAPLLVALTIITIMQYKVSMATIYVDHITTPKHESFKLYPNDEVQSQDGNTKLTMQSGGNLVLHTRTDALSSWTAPWETATDPQAQNGWTSLQWDGNLVVYNTAWTSQWGSDSWTNSVGAPNILVVSNAGYAYIITSKNNVIFKMNYAGTITPSLSSLDVTCTFYVLSIEHQQTNNGKYFNFDSNTIDIILDRRDWNGQNFTVYNQRTQLLNKVILWNATNGGLIGDSHGRKQPHSIAVDGDWQVNDMLTFMSIDCFTLSPTVSPTINTMSPSTNTQTPSFMPTYLPTISPTSNTASPTSNTLSPTKYPTKYPTNMPSKSPTNMPSIPPTKTPTKRPSKRPTNMPSKAPVIIHDGQAIDIHTTQSMDSDMSATPNQGLNVNGNADIMQGKLLIVIILCVVLGLLCICCVFVIIFCWKKQSKQANEENSKEVEMNTMDEMHRVSSVSAMKGQTTNMNYTNTGTYVQGMNSAVSNGEGFDGIDVTGNLPTEPNEDENTDSNNEIFLENVQPNAQHVTAGNIANQQNTPGNIGNDDSDDDTDDDNAYDIYKKPQAISATQGMQD